MPTIGGNVMPKKRFALFVTALVAVAASAMFCLRVAKPRTALAQQSPGSTLREIAKNSGGVARIVIEPDRSVIYPELADLARASTAVVLAKIVTNRCVVSSDEMSVTTDYSISISESIKGGLEPGASLVVSVEGGLALFEDEHALPLAQRTQAHVHMNGFIQLKNGATCVLFLKGDSIPNRFEITGGPQGAFDVSSGVVVPANMARNDALVQTHDKMDSNTFLQLVRAACAGH
jgi:hypothetical protein